MQDQIDEILELCKENNKILRGMRSQSRWSGFFSLIYYIFIIGSMVGAYYYIQPMLDPIIKGYENLLTNINEVKQNIPSADSLNITPENLDQLKKSLSI